MHTRHLVSLFAVGATAFLGACADDYGGADETTVTVTASPAPTAGGCGEEEFRSEFTEPGVLFCDGQWARARQWQTDHVLLFRFLDGQWQIHPHDGRSPVTEYICYDEARLRSAGAPEELIGQVGLCGTGE